MVIVRILPGVPGVKKQEEIRVNTGKLGRALSIAGENIGVDLHALAREGDVLVTVNGKATKDLDIPINSDDLVVVSPVVLGG